MAQRHERYKGFEIDIEDGIECHTVRNGGVRFTQVVTMKGARNFADWYWKVFGMPGINDYLKRLDDYLERRGEPFMLHAGADVGDILPDNKWRHPLESGGNSGDAVSGGDVLRFWELTFALRCAPLCEKNGIKLDFGHHHPDMWRRLAGLIRLMDSGGMPDGAVYVAGGEYEQGDGKRRFSLVKPGYAGGLPYVTTSPSGIPATEHHSHVYRLSADMGTAHLVRTNSGAGVGAPLTAKLSPKDFEGVKKAVGRGDDYGRSASGPGSSPGR